MSKVIPIKVRRVDSQDKAEEVKHVFFEVDETVEVTLVALDQASAEGESSAPEGVAGYASVASVTEIAAQVSGDFERIKETIVDFGRQMHGAIQQIPESSKVTAEFGIKLSGEFGVPYITKAAGEGSVKVTIEWAKASSGKG